jgi:hypothetical protein
LSAERGRNWGLVEILLLLALTVVGLPLAVREYETPPAPVERQPDFEKKALQLLDFAGLPSPYHVRGSEWVNQQNQSRPVASLAAARKGLENSRQLKVKLAPSLPPLGEFSYKNLGYFSKLYYWFIPVNVSIDTAGRVRELDQHWDVTKADTLANIDIDPSLAQFFEQQIRSGKSEAEARAAVNGAAEQSAEGRARAFSQAIDLHLPETGGSSGFGRNDGRELVYKEGLFQYVKIRADQGGEACILVATPLRIQGFKCEPKGRRTDSELAGRSMLFMIAVTLRLLTLLLFASALIRRLIKDEWDLRPSLKAGMIIAGLVLLAWPWPLEIRIGLLLWPIAALVAFVGTAATLAAFLSAIRADNEEAAAAFEGMITKRLLTREVLAAVGEGALGALALVGFVALVDALLFRLGWPHVPFLPDPSQFESAAVPIHWIHELRWAAIFFPLALMVIWLFHRLSLWFPLLIGRIFGALYAGTALGALMGVNNGSVSAMAGVALGFLLFARRYSSGGLLALVSAAFCWHLVPLALRLPPFGHGGTSAVMAALTLASLITFGVWGWLRAPSLASGDVYVPGYVNRTKEKNRLQRELEIARSVQLRFLPETAPAVAGVEIAFHCTPAMEVGGDYFDFLERPGALDVVVGDVSGKGVASAFYMTLAKGILHTLTRLDLAPDEVVRRLNVIFHANSPQGVFLTLAYASMDLASRRMVYFRAGHNSCLVRRAGGRVERLMPPGMIIGFDAGPRFNAGLGSAVVDLAKGDCVLLYTDGASEAMNSRSEEFGETRLSDALAGCDGGAQEILQAIERAVVDFCAGERQRDDLTLLVLKITE